MSLPVGARLGPYEVLAPLGAGGMGEVYRARDTRLERDVALKVLPAEVVADPARLERFAREARALAALNHPNIVTIHSTEEADGIRFLTMELVEGQSLDRVIPAGGMPVSLLLDVAIPLADAIAAAHDKGLTHRDLKPANVMVSMDGRVKVLDFGLASFAPTEPVASDATRMELTNQGTVLGTAPYMSPEQVEGKALDHRTDIFSLGIMLYEMAAGIRPFQGDSSPALMSSILRDTPAPLADVRGDLPGELSRLVARCLEKQPRDRVQTARDVFNELKLVRRELDSGLRSTTGPRTGAAPRGDTQFTITVVPVTARAGGAEANTVAECLTDCIVTRLSRFSYLRVHKQRGTDLDPGRGAYLTEGAVRVVGGTLRVTMQLTETASGASIWAETYDRALDAGPMLDVQDALADVIVATIADGSGALMRSLSSRVRAKSVEQLSPYEAVLRRFAYANVMSPEEHVTVRAALERAVEQAPGYADAWASLAYLYADEYGHGFSTARPDALERAQTAARRALAIDSSSQLAYQALAIIGYFSGEPGAFRAARARAVALNPLDTYTIAFLGALTAYGGDWDEGLAMCARAMQLNPHHPGVYHMASVIDHYRRGDYAGALEVFDRVNMPAYPATSWLRAAIYGQLGRIDAARAAWQDAQRALPNSTPRRSKFFPPALAEDLANGLRQAGIDV